MKNLFIKKTENTILLLGSDLSRLLTNCWNHRSAWPGKKSSTGLTWDMTRVRGSNLISVTLSAPPSAHPAPMYLRMSARVCVTFHRVHFMKIRGQLCPSIPNSCTAQFVGWSIMTVQKSEFRVWQEKLHIGIILQAGASLRRSHRGRTERKTRFETQVDCNLCTELLSPAHGRIPLSMCDRVSACVCECEQLIYA